MYKISIRWSNFINELKFYNFQWTIWILKEKLYYLFIIAYLLGTRTGMDRTRLTVIII